MTHITRSRLPTLFSYGLLAAAGLARAEPSEHPYCSPLAAGKSYGDTCSFTDDDQSQQGVCRKGRAGALVCLR